MSTRREFVLALTAAPAIRAASADHPPVRVLPVPRGGIQPQMGIAGDRLHLLYYTGEPQHGDISYVRSDDFGRTFSAPVRVNSQPRSALAIGSIRGAQIFPGKGNRVHVAWNGSDVAEPKGPLNPVSHTPGSPMLYARLNDEGTAFEPQRNLMQETFGLDGGGSVAAGRDGNVYVAWHGKIPGAPEGEAGRQVWIAQSADDGRSFTKERAAFQQPTGACGCCALRLFADSQGVLYGLYRSATQGVHRDIYLMRSADAGKTFRTDRLHPWELNACPMSSMSFVEVGGEVFGAWETQAQVYFAPLSGGVEAARRAVLAPPGADPKRKYPALARNRRGESLLAWADGAGWQRGGTLGWQIFDRAGKPMAAGGAPTKVPVWSFPAAFAQPDDSFTIVV